MAQTLAQRVTAEIDGEVVVFLIGMRINRARKIHKWLPVAMAMPRMIRELFAKPSSGFLGTHSWFGRTTIMLQYWRSFDDLERYAKDKSLNHFPAWVAFNRSVASNGDVGIWHETYRIRPGEYECIYNNMPIFGLAKATKATKAVPASGHRQSAQGRMQLV